MFRRVCAAVAGVAVSALAVIGSQASAAHAVERPASGAGVPHVLTAGHRLMPGTNRYMLQNGQFELEVGGGSAILDQWALMQGPRGPESVDTDVWNAEASNGYRAKRRVLLRMQRDGDLVLRVRFGRVLWHTGTHGARNRLVLRRNGALVVENGRGEQVWSAHTHAVFLGDGSTLPSGGILDSRYPSWYHGPFEWLRMQRDGDLVLRCGQKLIWSSRTHAAGSSLTLLRDGNLVVRSPGGRTVWRSHTRGIATYTYLAGNGLVLYNGRARIVWEPPRRHSPCDP